MKSKFLGIIFPLLLFATQGDTLQTRGMKWSQKFGIAGLGFSLLAIAADVEADVYYQKYQDATISDSCIYYRERTLFFEDLRNGFLGAGLLNFTVASILVYLEKRDSKYRLDLRFNKRGIGFTLIRRL